MGTIRDAAKLMWEMWGTKTLADLRGEAAGQESVFAYESVRISGGQRCVLVICVTEADQVECLERQFEFFGDETDEDWESLTLAEAVLRAFASGGTALESLPDEYKRRSAVVLIAAEPRSIMNLELLFGI
jgi:hypothetical protein